MTVLSNPNSRRTRTVVSLAWLGALGGLALAALAAHSGGYYGADFGPIYYGAKALLHAGDPYAFPAFVYPPSCALIFSPLTVVSEHAALAAGLVASTLSIVLIAYCASGVVRAVPLRVGMPVILILLAASPTVWEALETSNLSTLTAGLSMASVVALLRDRWLAAGWLLGLALLIKPVTLPIILLFLLRRRWCATVIALVVPLLGNLLTVPFLRSPADFVTKVLPTVLSGSTVTPAANVSLYGFGVRTHSADWAILLLRIVVVIAALESVRRLHRHTGPTATTIVALSPVLALMLATRVDEAFYSLIAVPMLIAIAMTRLRREVRALAAVSFVLIMVFGNIYNGFIPAHSATLAMIGQILAIAAGLGAAVELTKGDGADRRTGATSTLDR